MTLPYSLDIGLRYTRASKKSGMLSFLSSVSMLGLVVGVALLIVVLSVMNGFERELRERILALMPQASLYKAGGVENWQALRTQILSEEGVKGAAPFVQINALFSNRGNTAPGLVYGVEYDAEMSISLIPRFVSPQALEQFASRPEALLVGSELAKKLTLEVGDELMVVAPGGSGRRSAEIAYMPVVGFIDSATELDQSLVLANIAGLLPLRAGHLQSKVDGLRVEFDDLDRAPTAIVKIANALGPSYYQNNWQRTHGNLYHAIRISKNMVGLLMSLIVALAAFNIVSTLILVVTEKRASIAILRTLGASSKDILAIFIAQGLVIGTGGVFIGVAVGCGLSLVLEPALQALESSTGFQFLQSDTYPLSQIPAQILLSDLISVVVIALLLVLIATILPAVKAMRLQPADELRYE